VPEAASVAITDAWLKVQARPYSASMFGTRPRLTSPLAVRPPESVYCAGYPLPGMVSTLFQYA